MPPGCAASAVPGSAPWHGGRSALCAASPSSATPGTGFPLCPAGSTCRAQDRRGVGDQRGELRRPAPSNSAATRAVAAAAIAGQNAVNARSQRPGTDRTDFLDAGATAWTELDADTMTAPSSSPA
ncbi:hypothetical protein [Streptomyces panaciradicis]|uniref:hypothetical protein n=1 Tax=Streptomyces panaciradicis TaxID=1470261 RepID=UPI00201D1CF5|nr:hypothetical protein [Streptomyces panaciradicis]MCL6669971.1 hypothetical protein [Streptomyces panaciradicis]